MAKSPDFRRTAIMPAAPPAGVPDAAVQTALQGLGGRPLPTRKPMQASYTDKTRQQLEHLGWQDGDPVPPELAAKIQQIQREIMADQQSATLDIPLDRPPLKPGKTIDIRDLPEERQAELRSLLVEAKNEEAASAVTRVANAAIESQINPNSPPSVQAAQRAVMQAAQSQNFTGPTASVVSRPQLSPQAQVPEGKEVAGISGIAPVFMQPTPPVVDTNTVEPATTPPAQAGSDVPLDRCPRCLFDLRMQYDANPTDTDKQRFLAAMLSQTRFTKQYKLFGDQLQVIFRSLTSKESNLLFRQLNFDLQQGRIGTQAEYMMQLAAYRLAMSIAEVRNSTGAPIVEISPVFDIPHDTPGPNDTETHLVPLLKWFDEDGITDESLRRMLGQLHRHFQRTVEALEAMASEPDFWKEIG